MTKTLKAADTLKTAPSGSLTATGDVTITSDSDASGAGDVIVKTGVTEWFRVKWNGLVTGLLALLLPGYYSTFEYGAKGDAVQLTDGAITSGQATLTSASASFVAADVGKTVSVAGAGAAGVSLVTTITARNSATSVTLAANAGSTVTGTLVWYGTDDTAAIQSAINAANTAGGGIVMVRRAAHMGSGAAQLKLYDGVHVTGVGANFKDPTKGSSIIFATPAGMAGKPVFDVNNTKYAGVHRLAVSCAGADRKVNTTQAITDFSNSAYQATFLVVEDCHFRYFGGTCIGLYGDVNYVMRNSARDLNGNFVHMKDSGGGVGVGSDNFVAWNDVAVSPLLQLSDCSAGHGIKIENGSYHTIIGNQIFGCWNGIELNNGNYNRIEGNRCEKHSHNGIHVLGFHNLIVGNHCFNNGWAGAGQAGIAIVGTTTTSYGNQVVGNLCSQQGSDGGTNQDYGIYVEVVMRNQIVGNHVFACNVSGIYLTSGASNNQITGNFIDSVGHDGIILTTGCNDNQLHSNQIFNCGIATTNTYSGILITTTCSGNSLLGNTIRKVTGNNLLKYAINVATADCTANRLIDNDLTNAGATATINDAGTSTYKVGNKYKSAASQGTVALVAGTVTVSTTEVQTGQAIVLSRVTAAGTLGQLSVGTVVAGTSFVINSDNAADTSTIYWEIRH